MMIRYILMFILMTSVLQAKIDINQLLKRQQSASDKDLILVLNDISTYYFIKDDSLNFARYAIKALRLSQKLSAKSQVDALNHLSFVYSYHNRATISRDYAQKAYDLAKSKNYTYGENEALINLGYAAAANDIEKATKYYLKAINMSKKKGHDYLYAVSNAFIGLIYFDIENYNAAVKYMIASQKTFDRLLLSDSSLKTQYNYAELLNSLGNAYRRLLNWNEAKQYYLKYQALSYNLSNDYGIGIAFNNLGLIYSNQNMYNEAIDSYNNAKQVFESIGIDIYSATIYNNLATIYSSMKDYKKSQEYYIKAAGLFEKHEDYAGQAMSISNLADVYVTFSRINHEDKLKYLKLAEDSYFKAMSLINGQEKYILLACYEGLSGIYDSLRLGGKAYYYFKLYTQLKDSLSELTKSDEIAQITENYKYEKMIDEQKRKEREEQDLLLTKQRRKYNLEYMAILIFMIFLFAYLLFYNKHRRNFLPERVSLFARKITRANIESMVFVALLFLFEFFMVFIDPYINNLTNGEPVFNLMINGIVALALTPMDTYLEKVIRRRKVGSA